MLNILLKKEVIVKFSIATLLFRLLAKLVPPYRVVKLLPTMSQVELENAMRKQLKKWDDKTINQGIKDIKEGTITALRVI